MMNFSKRLSRKKQAVPAYEANAAGLSASSDLSTDERILKNSNHFMRKIQIVMLQIASTIDIISSCVS